MSLYDKVNTILNRTYIPCDNNSKLNKILKDISDIKNKLNNLTISYYGTKLKELNSEKRNILDDITCYNFYLVNNFDGEGIMSYDLHGISGNQLESFLDAIFDYHIHVLENNKFELIPGNGYVLKPKVIKYLDSYGVKYRIDRGSILILDFNL